MPEQRYVERTYYVPQRVARVNEDPDNRVFVRRGDSLVVVIAISCCPLVESCQPEEWQIHIYVVDKLMTRQTRDELELACATAAAAAIKAPLSTQVVAEAR